MSCDERHKANAVCPAVRNAISHLVLQLQERREPLPPVAGGRLHRLSQFGPALTPRRSTAATLEQCQCDTLSHNVVPVLWRIFSACYSPPMSVSCPPGSTVLKAHARAFPHSTPFTEPAVQHQLTVARHTITSYAGFLHSSTGAVGPLVAGRGACCTSSTAQLNTSPAASSGCPVCLCLQAPAHVWRSGLRRSGCARCAFSTLTRVHNKLITEHSIFLSVAMPCLRK